MITLHIPKDGKFDLGKEVMSARNIKDRQVRNNTLVGLNKIANYI
jgi:hypothetical protein